jgi:hypothetical protein
MSLRTANRLTSSALALALTAGAAYAAGAAHLSVSNQKLVGDEVTIAEANLPSNGFLAIHSSDAKGNMADRVLGYTELKAGDHQSVKVKLSSSQKPGEKLWAALHGDAGAKGAFEFGTSGKSNVDLPFKVSGKPVEMSFTLQ